MTDVLKILGLFFAAWALTCGAGLGLLALGFSMSVWLTVEIVVGIILGAATGRYIVLKLL